VGHGLLDHRPAVEVVAQRRFERGNFPFLHDCNAAQISNNDLS
jgi:hypothetical protein